jgi:hypothetical protein
MASISMLPKIRKSSRLGCTGLVTKLDTHICIVFFGVLQDNDITKGVFRLFERFAEMYFRLRRMLNMLDGWGSLFRSRISHHHSPAIDVVVWLQLLGKSTSMDSRNAGDAECAGNIEDVLA